MAGSASPSSTWTDARRQDQVVPGRVIEDSDRRPRLRQGGAGRAASAAGLDLDQRRHRLLHRPAAELRLCRDAAGDRHLGRRRQQRRPAGDRGARRRGGGRRHHQRPADRRGRAGAGGSITATTSSAAPTRSSWSRATPAPSARRCCASCWSRSPASRRPTPPEPAQASRTRPASTSASSCLRYGLRIGGTRRRPGRLGSCRGSGVAGDEQHPEPRPQLPRGRGQLIAGHAVRHDDIGEQQVDSEPGLAGSPVPPARFSASVTR